MSNGTDTQASTSLLEVRNLSVEFPLRREVLRVVDQVSFTVKRGEILGIVGESGAGKSMTGSAIIGLIDPPGRICEGEIVFDGKLVDGNPVNSKPVKGQSTGNNAMQLRGKHIGMVFQDPLTSLNPLQRIGDQIIETIRIHLRVSDSEATTRMKAALEEVGLDPTRSQAYPHEFSGGMRQRAVVALALCAEPQLIIADEPTTALDVSIQAQILDLLKRVCQDRGASVMLITHDMGVISETTNRVAVLYQGKLVEIGQTRDIIERPEHPYTKALIACTPTIEGGSIERDLVQIDRTDSNDADGEFNLRPAQVVNEHVDNSTHSSPLLIAKNLSREFDLSDPLLIRLLS